MDTVCLNDIKSLIKKDGGAHVSIFLPTHHRGGVDPQDPIRLRNLLRSAEEKLIARGMRAAEARTMLAPAERLLTENLFWRQQSDGLALFLDTNTFLYYRVPITLKEEVGVGERFYVKPLVSLFGDCNIFYVLAVSQDGNRLLQCTSFGSVRLNLNDAPKNVADALQYEVPDAPTQFHSSGHYGGLAGAQTSIQSGAISRANYTKDNISRYFEQINKSIIKVLKEEKAPLLLAGVDYLHPLYRGANSYRNLLSEGIMGNPDGVSDDILREQAWTIVKQYFEKERRDGGRIHKMAGTGLTASGQRIIPAPQAAGEFYLCGGAQQMGVFDATGTVKPSETGKG
jgi:hypothetical protein